ncbi:hypothetical protein [Streptomyces wuyuanensis]|uniref:hypothetical protein n=1 Tax=Streptomyces wuyuanensis TaxID=1196353 RepID=UPI003723172E
MPVKEHPQAEERIVLVVEQELHTMRAAPRACLESSPQRVSVQVVEGAGDNVAFGTYVSTPVSAGLVCADALEIAPTDAFLTKVQPEEVLHRVVFQIAEQQEDVGKVAHDRCLPGSGAREGYSHT